MKLPLMPLVDGCLFVDNSMLELLTTCPRQLEYNKLHARIAAVEKPSLNFGGAIHEALEYRYLFPHKKASEIEQVQTQILTAAFEARPVPSDDWRNVNWAVDLIHHYNAQYPIEPFNLLQYSDPITCPKCGNVGTVPPSCLWCEGTGFRRVMVEMPFALELCRFPINLLKEEWFTLDDWSHIKARSSLIIMYSGRIDLPVMWDHALFVGDHKTTSMLGPSFFERAAMSAQQRGYVWAFEALSGRKVNGYFINAIRSKEPPQYISDPLKAAPKGQSPAKWWSESFQRERFYTNPADIDEWRENTIELIHEFIWHYSRDCMPMKTAWCTQFGRCQYYDVCTLPRDSRGVMLSSGNYTNNTWSPLREASQSKQ